MSLWRILANLERLQHIFPLIASLIDLEDLDHIKLERYEHDRKIIIRFINVEGVEYARITIEKLT